MQSSPSCFDADCMPPSPGYLIGRQDHRKELISEPVRSTSVFLRRFWTALSRICGTVTGGGEAGGRRQPFPWPTLLTTGNFGVSETGCDDVLTVRMIL